MVAAVITWTDNRTFVTDQGTEFLTMGDEGTEAEFHDRFAHAMFTITAVESTPERFVLLKTRQAMDRYLTLIDRVKPKRIVDVGVFRGGSVAMLAELADPDLLVAIEYQPVPIPALERYLGDRCRVHYGIDQADSETVAKLVGDAPLDLVIDDASHQGTQTRATFDTLFPMLRPGGVYLIEDWSWHLHGLELGEPMDTLVTDLINAAGRGRSYIASVELTWDAIILTRGDGPIV